jgi:RNA polymerase sigma-70 factor (ECF subfamily)
MLRVRDDDPVAFEELVELYQQRLVTIMHHLVGNKEEAEDLAQEVFLRVYRTRKKYRPRAKFSTWLFTIANNLALNALRSRQRKPVIPLEARDSGPLGPRPAEQLVRDREHQPSEHMQQQELAAIVQQALGELNERQRAAVVLNKFEDMNYAEIAEVMNLTTKAVKSLLSRARDNLRQTLKQYILMDEEPQSK